MKTRPKSQIPIYRIRNRTQLTFGSGRVGSGRGVWIWSYWDPLVSQRNLSSFDLSPLHRRNAANLISRVFFSRCFAPPCCRHVSMATRWRYAGKSDPSDEVDKAETVVVLTSSDDEEANEDLSLAIVEKAKQSKAKRKSVEASLVNISSDEAELDKNEANKTGREGSRKKKRVKKKKKERDVADGETVSHACFMIQRKFLCTWIWRVELDKLGEGNIEGLNFTKISKLWFNPLMRTAQKHCQFNLDLI